MEKWKGTLDPIESVRHAAQRWCADFFELVDVKYPEFNQTPVRSNSSWNGFTGTKMWQLVWMMENFGNYEKVLYLDNDVFINSNAPNIFDLLEDFDIAGVLDGNKERIEGGLLNLSKAAMDYEDCIGRFKEIPGFSNEKYFESYLNTGVILFNGKSMAQKISHLKDLMLNNQVIADYINNHPSPIDQNLFSAWCSTGIVSTKILPMEWNWIAPDIVGEFEDFMGPMKPNIFHFCGTDLIKERIAGYRRWNQEENEIIFRK